MKILLTGPAKAYTLRGKYRQFFLRVTADNMDEAPSSNVIVSHDRTLDIVVEMVRESNIFPDHHLNCVQIPTPGTIPQPPQIPPDMMPSRSPSPQSDDNMHVDNLVNSAYQEVNRDVSQLNRRKRAYSMDHDEDHYPQEFEAGSSRLPGVRQQPPKVARLSSRLSRDASNSPPRSQYDQRLPSMEWHFDSPDTDEEPNRLHDLISKR